MDSNEQTILTNFYNSLTSTGTLNWNVANNLCGQTGVTCDSSNPRRITTLYSLFSSFFLFYPNKQSFEIDVSFINRDINSRGLSGTIPTQFGNLVKLQLL